MGFSYYEPSTGCASFSLRTFSDSFSRWDPVATADSPELKLRFGKESSELGVVWSEWKKVLCNELRLKYYPNGVEVIAAGVDKGFSLSEKHKTKVYKEKKISEIVEEIAGRHSLDTDIGETDGKYTLYQCVLPDGQFIRRVLLPKAVNGSGRNDYYFFIKDGKQLVFKFPDFGKEDFTFDVGIPSSPVGVDTAFPGFEITRRRVWLASDDTYSIKFRGFDPLEKEVVEWTADDDSVQYEKLARTGVKAPSDPARVFLTTCPDEEQFKRKDVEDRAKAWWSRALHGHYRTQWRVALEPKAEVISIVRLNVLDPDGVDHFSSGKWLVYSLKHELVPGKAISTVFFLERRTHS